MTDLDALISRVRELKGPDRWTDSDLTAIKERDA